MPHMLHQLQRPDFRFGIRNAIETRSIYKVFRTGHVIIKPHIFGQIAYLIDTLHLSYTEVFEIIPYRNLLMMQRDKLHAVYGGQKVNRISGKELANRRKKK